MGEGTFGIVGSCGYTVWMWIAFKGLQALHFNAHFLYFQYLAVASLPFIGVVYNEP